MEGRKSEGEEDGFGSVWKNPDGWNGNSKTSTEKRRKSMRASVFAESKLMWV